MLSDLMLTPLQRPGLHEHVPWQPLQHLPPPQHGARGKVRSAPGPLTDPSGPPVSSGMCLPASLRLRTRRPRCPALPGGAPATPSAPPFRPQGDQPAPQPPLPVPAAARSTASQAAADTCRSAAPVSLSWPAGDDAGPGSSHPPLACSAEWGLGPHQCATSTACAVSVLATSRQPLVPRSKRCTMPRASAPACGGVGWICETAPPKETCAMPCQFMLRHAKLCHALGGRRLQGTTRCVAQAGLGEHWP
jgi:hypothetical protein